MTPGSAIGLATDCAMGLDRFTVWMQNSIDPHQLASDEAS